MNRDLMFSSKSDLWCTPQELFDSLNKEFNFTYDLCATKQSAKCKDFCSPEEDAFKKSIVSETIWCNPPYGREIGKWVKLCYEKQKRADAQIVVMLIPARTDTKWFHDYILGKAEIRFIKGRLKFINKEDAYKFEIHTPQCATNAAEVADEFAAMGCTCGAKTRISPAPFPSMLVIYGKSPSIYSADKLGKPEEVRNELEKALTSSYEQGVRDERERIEKVFSEVFHSGGGVEAQRIQDFLNYLKPQQTIN